MQQKSPSKMQQKSQQYVKTKHRCHCQAHLVLISDNSLYDGDVACCDRCGIDIPSSEPFFHCERNYSDQHPGGFDLCSTCTLRLRHQQPKDAVNQNKKEKQNVVDEDVPAEHSEKSTSKDQTRRPSLRSTEEKEDVYFDDMQQEHKEPKQEKEQDQAAQGTVHNERFMWITKKISSKSRGKEKEKEKVNDGKTDIKRLKKENKLLSKENKKQKERIKYLETQLYENETSLKRSQKQVSELEKKKEQIDGELYKLKKQNAKLQPNGEYNALCLLEEEKLDKNKKVIDFVEKMGKMEEILSNMYRVFSNKFEKQQNSIQKLQKKVVSPRIHAQPEDDRADTEELNRLQQELETELEEEESMYVNEPTNRDTTSLHTASIESAYRELTKHLNAGAVL